MHLYFESQTMFLFQIDWLSYVQARLGDKVQVTASTQLLVSETQFFITLKNVFDALPNKTR